MLVRVEKYTNFFTITPLRLTVMAAEWNKNNLHKVTYKLKITHNNNISGKLTHTVPSTLTKKCRDAITCCTIRKDIFKTKNMLNTTLKIFIHPIWIFVFYFCRPEINAIVQNEQNDNLRLITTIWYLRTCTVVIVLGIKLKWNSNLYRLVHETVMWRRRSRDLA